MTFGFATCYEVPAIRQTNSYRQFPSQSLTGAFLRCNCEHIIAGDHRSLFFSDLLDVFDCISASSYSIPATTADRAATGACRARFWSGGSRESWHLQKHAGLVHSTGSLARQYGATFRSIRVARQHESRQLAARISRSGRPQLPRLRISRRRRATDSRARFARTVSGRSADAGSTSISLAGTNAVVVRRPIAGVTTRGCDRWSTAARSGSPLRPTPSSRRSGPLGARSRPQLPGLALRERQIGPATERRRRLWVWK